MAEKFYSLLTKIGKAKIANSIGFGTKINFTKMKVGDGGGDYYEPTEEQTDLKNTVWEGNINHVEIDKDNPSWIHIELMIPATVGGFTIREYGAFDDENNLIGICKCAETYKPVITDGSTKELLLDLILCVVNTANIQLKIDPTIIFAKKSDLEVLDNKINNIKIPVTSVNTKTGDIMLKAEDINCNDGKSVESHLDDVTEQIKGIEVTAEKTKLNNPNFKSNNVNGALNELFQNASNNKQKLVDIITGLGGYANVSMSYTQIYESLINLPSLKTYKDDIVYGYVMDKWRYRLNMNTVRNNAAAINYKDNVYIVGGIYGNDYHNSRWYTITDMEIIDVNTAKTTIVHNLFKGERIKLHIYNDKLYAIGGGYDIEDPSVSKGFRWFQKRNIEEYDLIKGGNILEVGSWEDKANDINNFLYAKDEILYFEKNYIFNLNSKTWSIFDHGNHEGILINNKVYTFYSNGSQYYDINTRTTTNISSPFTYTPSYVCAYDEKVYIISGGNLYIFNSKTSSFSLYTKITIEILMFSAIAFCNNKLFLIGGAEDEYRRPTSNMNICIIN